MTVPVDPHAPRSGPLSRAALVRTFGLLAFILAWFGLAGRLTWWSAWALLLSVLVYVSLLVRRLTTLNPDLLRERNQPAESAEPWDRVLMRIYVAFLLVLLAIAALDSGRYRWSSVPPVMQLAGWLLLVVAGAMVWHVMMTNSYLSSWSRLQDDRAQVVVRHGAYAHVRHPMYLAIIVAFLGIPVVLSSWWAVVPGLAIVGLFVYRTHREDLMLQRGLPGYAEYSEQVRYRLLPPVW